MTPISLGKWADSSTQWLPAGRPPRPVEVDVPHVVVEVRARSMRQGLGAACLSKRLAVGRAETRVEVDVLRVIVAGPAESTC
jgi:hypothetical protein